VFDRRPGFVGPHQGQMYPGMMNLPPGMQQNSLVSQLPAQLVPPSQHMYPPDIKPDIKPMINNDDEGPRFTFARDDLCLMPPFKLEHDNPDVVREFCLKTDLYQQLFSKGDMDIQFKCYHFNDKYMNTNWPNHGNDVSVMINNQNVPIPVTHISPNQTSHQPMFIKKYCNPGRNVITIQVRACCCSHLFTLQIVNRPSVRSIFENISKQNLLKSEESAAKIKRNFATKGAGGLGNSGEDAIEQTAITVSLKCPTMQGPIRMPARGRDCKHIQCFDLENFLTMNSRKESWSCPVCKKPAPIRGLEVDELIWGIIRERPEVDEVKINPNATWSPVTTSMAEIKKEQDDTMGLPIKRCRTDDYQIRPPADQR